MTDRLRDKVAMGVAWSVAEKIGSMLLQVAVSIIVARLLMPDDFGVMAIMTFFTALALVVVDSGFSQTLIRKSEPTAEDYKSVFVFNIAISVLLYIGLTLTAPIVARFYEHDVIARIAPVLFLLLPVNALCVIQNTIFIREFRFDMLSKINFASSCVAGVIAIAMALAGMGVWALVGQRLGTMTAKAALLWLCSDWRAGGVFSTSTLRAMSPFSFRLMFTDIISAVYNNVAQLFIGKMYSTDTLGYFNQAQKLKELPVSSAMQSIQSVTYPALSNIKNDAAKFADSYRRVMMVTAFVMFPMMVGMIAVADDMFALLLGERWMPTVPYFRILSLCGVFYPVSMIAYNILKVKSDGSIIIRLEVVKKIVTTVILAVTIPYSVTAVAWGLVAMTAVEAAVNIAASTRFANLGAYAVLRTLAPIALLTAAMYLVVTGVAPYVAGLNLLARLTIEIVAGAAFYLLSALLFRMESIREMKEVVVRLKR